MKEYSINPSCILIFQMNNKAKLRFTMNIHIVYATTYQIIRDGNDFKLVLSNKKTYC